LDENKRKIEHLGAEIDGLKKERYQNEQKISNLEIEVDQRVADLSLKERENEELKSTIKDLEAKLSKKEEKAVSSDDEIDDEDVGAHHVFPGVWQVKYSFSQFSSRIFYTKTQIIINPHIGFFNFNGFRRVNQKSPSKK